MKKVMRRYDAVGLAAPQIGVPLRIIAIEFSASRKKEFDDKTYKARQMQTVPFKVSIQLYAYTACYWKYYFLILISYKRYISCGRKGKRKVHYFY
jgi:hypothetical protein